MRRTGVLILSLVLLCLLSAAMAEGDDTEANFEGGWVPLGGSGYQIYLPIDWASSAARGDEVFSAAATGGAMRMSVTYKDNQNTVESILAMLASTEGYTGVQVVTYNSRTFVTYKDSSQNALCAVTLSGNGSRAVWFTFTPSDNSCLAALSAKILNSFAPNQ